MNAVTADIFNGILEELSPQIIAEALNAHAVVCITSIDGTIIRANHAFCQLSGYSETELYSQSHQLINFDFHTADFFADLWQSVSIGHSWHGEIKNRSQNGRIYWLLCTVVPILGSKGYPEKCLVISTDISQQKIQLIAENQQRRMLDLFRQVLQEHLVCNDLIYACNQMLSGLLQLCCSQFGFIGRLLPEDNSQACLNILAIHHKGWDETSVAVYQQQVAQGLQMVKLDSLFGDVVTSGNVVLDNACEDNRGCGFPDTVVTAHQLLGIPIYFGKKLLGVVGLANKADGYGEMVLEYMRSFVETCSYLILSTETKNQAQQAAAQTGRLSKTPPSAVPSVVNPPLTETTVCRVLVAEDNLANQAVLKIQLQVLGVEADMVSNGLEALKAWESQHYDLLLTDVNMPIMDGLALANSIRAHKHSDKSHLPIIAITAISEDEKVGDFRQSGIDDVLAKPIELEKLRQIFVQWLPKQALPIRGFDKSTEDAARNNDSPYLPILDHQAITHITGILPAEQVQALTRLFIDTAKVTLADCQQYLQIQDTIALAMAMHKLKSSALSVGAARFAEQARFLEQQAKSGFSPVLADMVSGLLKALEDVVDTAKMQSHSPASKPSKPSNSGHLQAEAILAGLRNNEFEMYFQPRVDAQTLQPMAIEALARWRHQGEVRSADSFIFAAEAYGLIDQLSEVLFIKAFVAGARLAANGFNIPIAVNLPFQWLNNPNLLDFIQSSLYATGFSVDQVILEVDEGTVVDSLAVAIPKLQEFRRRGFSLAINHFSAIPRVVEQLPLDAITELKIEKQVLAQLATQTSAFASLLAMLQKQQCLMVAKSIENEAEMLWVKTLGIDCFQGWHIAEPMLVDALLEWLSTWKASA